MFFSDLSSDIGGPDAPDFSVSVLGSKPYLSQHIIYCDILIYVGGKPNGPASYVAAGGFEILFQLLRNQKHFQFGDDLDIHHGGAINYVLRGGLVGLSLGFDLRKFRRP